MTPTDAELAAAVDAAARASYIAYQSRFGGTPYDDVGDDHRRRARLAVQDAILAALEALPDRAVVERRRVASYAHPLRTSPELGSAVVMLNHWQTCGVRWGAPCSCRLDALEGDLRAVGAPL